MCAHALPANSRTAMRTNLTVVIRVRGHLSRRLAAAFDGMTSVRLGRATELIGGVTDQAQLYGLITRVRDLGLALESVTVAETDEASGRSGSRGRARMATAPRSVKGADHDDHRPRVPRLPAD